MSSVENTKFSTEELSTKFNILKSKHGFTNEFKFGRMSDTNNNQMKDLNHKYLKESVLIFDILLGDIKFIRDELLDFGKSSRIKCSNFYFF